MKIKNILMAGVVALTSISLPTLVNAETTYATPQELLIEALEVAVSGVESTTYDEALDYVESLITVNGSEVSYDGDVIGYWDSTNSDTLFADSAFTDEVLSNGGTNIWEFDPDILSPMLTDFNNKLVETIVPTTEDWSKIIGKYDITLGSVTIPANQWVYLDSSVDPFLNKVTYNLTSTTGLRSNQLGDTPATGLVVKPFLVDENGDLYLGAGSLIMYRYSTAWVKGSGVVLGETTVTDAQDFSNTNPSDTTTSNVNSNTYLHLGLQCWDGKPSRALASIIMTDATMSSGTHFRIRYDSDNNGLFFKAGDAATSFTGDISTVKTGVLYLNNPGTAFSYDNAFITNEAMFATQSSSKQQIGNTLLKQRLSKFSSLVEGDTIEVTPTSWTIKGLGGEESDFDTYLGSQDIMAPGEETSIPATADIEALAFKVVLPTSLPIYVNELNQVSVATNATIKNESGAAVIINSVNIEAKPDSGWTLLTSGTPSKARDAKEFTFTTDLVADTVLAVAEERPFRYNAELSPSTEGVEQLDLASVLVTIDWAS